MMLKDLPIVCNHCTIPHIQNCPACFGYGVWNRKCDGRLVPVSACSAQSQDVFLHSETSACLVCNSSIEGLNVEGLPNG